MSARAIRVGIIGASPRRGWARRAHIPALAALPQFTVTAVATRDLTSAGVAAGLYGATHALTDARTLAEHPEVDVVVIAVKVPLHADLVMPALEAGKPVYCEWPLGQTTMEAECLAKAAMAAGVTTAIGLQGRFAPEVVHARQLIEEGYLGRVTSVAVYATHDRGAVGEISEDAAYTIDRANGAGLLEIMGGHTLDVVRYLVGDITSVCAMTAQHRREFTIAETRTSIVATTPDHVLLTATLTGGAVLSMHLNNGKVNGQRTSIEIAGTNGDLVISTAEDAIPHISLIQMGDLRLVGGQSGQGLNGIAIPERLRRVNSNGAPLSNAVGNVARLYAGFAEDIYSEDQTVPDFTHAVRLHHVLDAVRKSAETGHRQVVGSAITHAQVVGAPPC